ncbi:hypothetical protein NQ314_000269, partial [Rhamnusium bicolor]
MGNCPVVFVPSHRSYADFILMSLVCFTYDIEIPAIAAGMDFHAMWGMGSMLRDTGAFFMRRSYNDDGLYWTTFKQYIYQLVTKGDLPIEFFIEGTRSRSNKSLAPKYVSLILNNNLATRQELLTVEELTKEVYWLKGVIELYGAFVHTENVEDSIKDCFIVHNNLIEVTAGDRVCLVRNNIVLDKINPSKLKAHSLSDQTITYALPFVMLQIYINPTLQYFVDSALLVVILNCQTNLNK